MLKNMRTDYSSSSISEHGVGLLEEALVDEDVCEDHLADDEFEFEEIVFKKIVEESEKQ
jgi:hypothetical protein